MRHIRNLLVKFIATFAVLFIILGMFYDMSFGNVLAISLVLTLAAYLIGDMLILPRTNNTMATLADFGLAFLVIWLMGENITYGDSLLMPALIAAAAIALFEAFFHKSVANQINNENNENQQQSRNLRYQTEASKELTPRKNDMDNKNKNNQ
ncbi:YndM family protein [Niallia sp. Krafla_26]|uniref:YndM family protein n=1 Tax=Niallia sp. Krafla_26 TaxID=3064703 RepID=UPI003D1652E4